MTTETRTIVSQDYEYRRDEVLAGWYERRQLAPSTDDEVCDQIQRLGLAGKIGEAEEWTSIAPGSICCLPRSAQRAIARL
jgi:hypothetical protein